jgi:hypothetical protein
MFTSYTGIMGSAVASYGTYGITGCCDTGGSGLGATNGIIYQGSKTTLTGITDGTSNTWMVAEQSGHVKDPANAPVPGAYGALTSQGPHGWAMGTDSNTSGNGSRVFNCTAVRYQINQTGIVSNGTTGSTGVNQNAGANIPISANHTGGANVLSGDGTVRFFTNSTPLATISALCTRDGGESVAIDP